ncbi:MAG: hypothetical protein AAF632_05350 [Bacteroidota bacterium]
MKWLVAFFLIALLGCNEDDISDLEIRDDPSITSLNGTWKVIAYEDYEQGELITKTEENSWNMDVIITFDDTINPPSITGKNTTNSIFGSFEYTGHRSFQTAGFASTYVSQPEWADTFAKIFEEGEQLFIINETQLKITNTSRKLTAILEKE